MELLVLPFLLADHVHHLLDLDLLRVQLVYHLLLRVALSSVYHRVHVDLLLDLLELVAESYLNNLQLFQL